MSTFVSHARGPAYDLRTVPVAVNDFIDSTVKAMATELRASGFVGAYLHGSLAMGSYYLPKSDIDLLFVVEESLTADKRRSTARRLADLSDARPTVGDLEVSVLRAHDLVHFRHPSPYEVHYSGDWKDRVRGNLVDYSMERTDPDLAAHCAAIKARGVALAGLPVRRAFGPVPLDAVQKAIYGDLDWILQDDNIVKSPFYGVLNCCRVLALQVSNWQTQLSKDEGAAWALGHVPVEHRQVIRQAVECYHSAEPVDPAQRRTDGHSWDPSLLRRFRDYVKETVH